MNRVKFGAHDALEDWGIYLVSSPSLETPEVRTKFLESPGLNGAIDLTTAIRGYPVYKNRTGSLVFASADRWAKWNARRGEILGYLHGQAHTLEFDDDPGWYWEGRFSVRRGDEMPRGATITIDYNVGPFKWSVWITTEPWLWNPFSFVDGVIGNGTYVDSSTTPPTVWQGSGLYSGIEVGSTPVDLTFSSEEVTGSAPQQVTFSASDAAITVTVLQGTTTAATGTFAAGTSGTIPGLVLYRGAWLYQGWPASVSASTGSGSDTGALALSFRRGVL